MRKFKGIRILFQKKSKNMYGLQRIIVKENIKINHSRRNCKLYRAFLKEMQLGILHYK